MAQRDGDGIGRIVRPGHAVQPEQAARHIHDLMLLRLAVADDGLLDLHGCVFKQRHARPLDGEQDDAASVRNADAGRDIVPPE